MVSVNVSIKGFNNTLYSVREEENAIFLTTECTFHVSLSEMQIYWYINDQHVESLHRFIKDNRPRTASSPKSGCNIWCKVGIAVGAAICSVASCCICCCVCKGWCVNKGKDKDRIASYRMSCITYVGAYFPDHCRKNKTNPGSNNATVLTDGQGTSELAVSIHE
ncbi:hypothetical protein MAR_021568, partial [Mya arenaria]